MAIAAVVKHLLFGELGERWIGPAAFSILILPIQMALHGAVTGLAPHSLFGHGGMIGVGRGIIIFVQPRVMTRGAHVVPVHAAPRPMSPLTGLAVFTTKGIKPFVTVGIIGSLQSLEPAAGKSDEELPE